jgi:hypothetical protein
MTAWLLVLGLATFSNALSLTVIGLRDYLESGAGGAGDESKERLDLEDLAARAAAGLAQMGDRVRRRAVDHRVPENDWAQYTPYPPGTPSFVRGHPRSAEAAGYRAIRDGPFVVFYKPPLREADAQTTLQYLQRGSARVVEVWGRLPRSEGQPERKIAVFLPATGEEFEELVRLWEGPARGLVGFCAVAWDATLRPYPVGIFIRPTVLQSPDFLPVVVTHELAHYAFELTRDVRRRTVTASWFSEGLAEYVAENVDRLKEIPERRRPDQSLLRRSPPDGDWRWRPDDYWLGLSAFLVMDSGWGEARVKELAAAGSRWSTDEVLARTGIPLPVLERAWEAALPALRRQALGGR